MQTPHATASEGFQSQADSYAKARPKYPQEAIEFIRSLVPSSFQAPYALLDLGAGTGIMTQLLFDQGIYNITAVEPVDNMRAKIESNLPKVTTLKGTAWSIPVPSESQDIVMLAQCFHWFDDIKSLKEIYRVLKPGGLVILIWNMESKERSTWVAKLRELYEAYDGAAPQYRKGYWKQVFEIEEAKELYKLPLQHKQFMYDVPANVEDIWPRILSKSYIAILDQETRDKLHAEVQKVLDDELPKEGTIIYRHDTDMYWCQKK